MFVQALAAYADEKLKDELNDVAFEERAVPYFLSLAADGRFLAAMPRFESVAPASGKGKPKQRPQTHRVPRSPVNRNAGQHPLLAADEIGYVLSHGPWTKPGDIAKVAKLHEAFVALIRRVEAETRDEALLACSRFYSNPEELQRAHTRLMELEAAPGSNIALYFDGDPVTDRETVQLWWRKHYEAATQDRASTETAECLISGVVGPVPPTHPKIKHTAALGGQPSGVSLMSFDKGAFRSYGWEQNANSPVSADRAMAYVLALNSLLKPGSPNRKDFGDVAFLFWLRKDSPLNPAEMLDATPTPAYIEEAQRILELRRDAWLEDSEPFYMAALSATGSRVILRSWITELLPVAADNVFEWWKGLSMPFRDEQPITPSFGQLLKAIKRQDPLKPFQIVLPTSDRILALRRRALEGPRKAPLDYRILADAINRIRAEVPKRKDGKRIPGRRLNRASMGLLRLFLNDLHQSSGQGEPMPVSLEVDPPNTNRAYLCGRLLAVHEYLQWKTFDTARENQPNSTVADRYYNLMMTSPSVALVQVCKLGRNHLKKLRRFGEAGSKAANNLQMQIEKLMVLLGDDPPPAFGMHDKARFALGFYHQKAFRPKKAVTAEDSTEIDTTLIPDDIPEDTAPEKESAQ
jgi:CRISPR-associated protein Csd1